MVKLDVFEWDGLIRATTNFIHTHRTRVGETVVDNYIQLLVLDIWKVYVQFFIRWIYARIILLNISKCILCKWQFCRQTLSESKFFQRQRGWHLYCQRIANVQHYVRSTRLSLDKHHVHRVSWVAWRLHYTATVQPAAILPESFVESQHKSKLFLLRSAEIKIFENLNIYESSAGENSFEPNWMTQFPRVI